MGLKPHADFANRHTLPENDWSAPLDVAGQLTTLPRDGWIRGVFPDALVKQLRARGVDPGAHGHYHVLSKYALADYMDTIVFCAGQLFPELPLRQAVRLVGRFIYPAFFDSMVGKAIFAVAGRSYRRAVEVAPKAYHEVGISPGSARIVALREGYAYVELRSVWPLTEAYQPGIWEGALEAFGAVGTVRTKIHSACDIDLEVVWTGANATPDRPRG
jgi:uncharacterized protein (TIGR02265 family)